MLLHRKENTGKYNLLTISGNETDAKLRIVRMNFLSECRTDGNVVFGERSAFMDSFPTFPGDLWSQILPECFHLGYQLRFATLYLLFKMKENGCVQCLKLLMPL